MGPAIGAVVEVEESVLLLETEPGLLVGVGLHDLQAVVAVVVLVGSAIGIPALSENNNVGRATEGVGEDGARSEVDIGVVAGSLVGGGAIEVPDGKILGLVLLVLESL